MTPEQYRRIGELFDAALDTPAAARSAFLEKACNGDSQLRREVQRMLEKHLDESGLFLSPGGTYALAEEREILPVSIGPYLIRKQLGEGGMGTVYLAEQTEPISREVALKVIRPGMGSKSVIARFASERQTLAMMDHPYIAQVFDVGTTSLGLPYFAMELVDGVPITFYCERKQLGIRGRIDLFVEVCEAIQYAHQKGIIHRDIKPSNVLVREIDGKPIPKVIDFGLAKALDATTDSGPATVMGTIIGTLQYMSPEQAEPGRKDIDTRSDVYALGVLLYELLTSKTPLNVSDFPNDGYLSLLKRINEVDAKPPSTLGGGPFQSKILFGDLDAITLKALARDRSRRYASPSELAADIKRYLNDEPVVARPAGRIYHARKYVRRHWLGVSFAAIVGLLLVATFVGQSIQLRRIKRERDRADRVTGFMTSMFKVSNPSESRGNDIRAREILDKASQDIDTGLADDPQLRAQLLHTMSTVYDGLGLYAKADSLARRAVDIQRTYLGMNNLETIQSVTLLATVLGHETNYKEAEKWSRQALQAGRQTLGSNHRDTVHSMLRLGWNLIEQGRAGESEALAREAIEIARREFGSQDPVLQQALRLFGTDLDYQGVHQEAEKAYREALGIDRHLYGTDDNLNVLDDRDDIAGTLYMQGRSAEAVPILTDVVERRRRILGPEHPDTVISKAILANALHAGRRYSEAAKLHRETLAIRQRVFGPEYRWTLYNMTELADVLRRQGQYPEAERLVRQSLETQQRTLGPGHPDTLRSALVLGEILRSEKRYAEAGRMLEQSLDNWRRLFGPKNPKTIEAAYQLGLVLAAQGRHDEAFSQLQFALQGGLVKEDREDLEKDSDLNALRGDPQLASLVARPGP
jgi:eukaryotic-like serine/threonine-protein kinase